MAFISTKGNFLKAAASGDVKELAYCLDTYNYDINLKNSEKRTALFYAADSGNMDSLSYLISKNAAIETADVNGSTPLLIAAKRNNTAAALALIAAGANVNTHDDGYTYPLHWAAKHGNIDVIRALVDAGAELDVRTLSGEFTPLYRAIEADRGPATEVLVAAGARTDIPDAEGKTPYDWAKEKSAHLAAVIERERRKSLPAGAAAPANEDTPIPPEYESGEKWARMGEAKIARVGTFPDMNRRLTEVFNFESRERVIISENLKTGAESIGQPEAFDTLPEETVLTAASELEKRGGKPSLSPKKSFSL